MKKHLFIGPIPLTDDITRRKGSANITHFIKVLQLYVTPAL